MSANFSGTVLPMLAHPKRCVYIFVSIDAAFFYVMEHESFATRLNCSTKYLSAKYLSHHFNLRLKACCDVREEGDPKPTSN